MENLKAVKDGKINFHDRDVLLYFAVCAVTAIQPFLEIISSIVINAGSSGFISVSGAVRAFIMIAVAVYSLAFYKGKYKKIFSGYLIGVSTYILLVCIMTAARGTAVAVAYMIGLMADTFFFQFMFIMIVETYQTLGRRISPSVLTFTAFIYAATLAINYISGKNTSFNFSSSFAVSLALIIPCALVFLASRISFTNDEANKSLKKVLPCAVSVICIAVVLTGAVLSNSKPVFFVSVIFSAIFFVWSFSNWRNKSFANRKPLFAGFIVSAVFCVLILALLPVSPVKSSFDGTFKLSELFYTYSGSQQTPGSSSNGEIVFPFDDEDDDGFNDYVPNLNSGYDPNDDRDDDSDDETTANGQTDVKTTNGKTTRPPTTELEPAGDESTSEEVSDDTTQEETTKWWQNIPSLDISDILSTLPIPSRPPTSTSSPDDNTTVERSSEPDTHEETEAESEANEIPVAAIGMGSLSVPKGLNFNAMAINLDRVKYFSDSFFSSNAETWLFGLRFSSLFDETLSPALKLRSDPFSVFLNYGIFGLIAYILPALFIFLRILKFIIMNLSSVSGSIGCMAYMFSAVVIMILSLFDGDVIAFSAVGAVASVILANAFCLCDEAENLLN